VNEEKAYFNFTASDRGLGVHKIIAKWEGTTPATWSTTDNCTGVSRSACPLTWSYLIGVEPANMPTGYDNVSLVAEDPVGHVSTVAHPQLGVDHTVPEVTVGGTATEQATLGTKRASYSVKVSDADGSAARPQSGVAKVSIAVDGTTVKKVEPGCATENCTVPTEWQLESGQYAPGQHTITVTATDGVGLSTTKTISIQLQPSPPPSVSLAGSATEQATLGTSRPRYLLKANASALAGSDGSSPYEIAYSSAFGTAGTAAGQFNHPADVAIDAQGNLWVVDKANNRIEEFTESGGSPKAFGSLGSTGGKLSSPSGIVIDSSGNVWVTDTGNTRVVEFGKAGEFLATFGTNVNKTKVEAAGTQAEKNLCTAASKNVCQAGTAGGAEGQMKEPIGIASSSGGNLYVVEKGNGRVEKFSPSGELLAKFGGPGSGSGQLLEPTAVAVAPDASIWVADAGNNRIQHWNSTFTAVSAYGKEGAANGEFKHPDAIEVDPLGNVFVADQGNGRVQEFSENGVFLTRFSSSGAGIGQVSLTDPAGIAANGKGEIWVTDTGGNRVEKWTQQILRSEISTKIKIDGKQVSTGQATCTGESCPLTSEWILESAKYPVGKHTIEVEATDGLGRSTTKTLAVELQPDTTKPVVQVGGELYEAPAGWVEQESYGITIAGSDAGAGVTSLVLKLDGQAVVSQTLACAEGGCGAASTKSINMSSYAGGAHSAEVVATDGAGNVTTKNWTLNVDPDGHITAAEATDTLEAADTTAESSVVAPTSEVLEPEQIEDGLNPALHVVGAEIASSGTPDPTRMTTDPGDGFTIQSPEGITEVTPNVSESSSNVSVSEGVAGVSANIANQVDSVIRPEYNGVQIFQAIRSEESPEKYSWTVHLASRQSLRLANPSQAEVYYPDGTICFLVTAEPAHDATGHPVPTSLEVNGNVLTLKVEFKSGTFVYPIVAGQGWETSYTVPVIVQGPEDEAQIREREERERAEREAAEAGEEATLLRPPVNTFR
jgi:streptogramin lyase